MPECHSTNTLALQLSENPLNAEGTVVITSHQTAGRGQRGSHWEAEAGMNLTFSVILKPAFLSVADQFCLTMITSLALYDFLVGNTDQPVHIKWPNDILVHGRKISGILIENQIQGSRLASCVAGIGLNVNQTRFAAPGATSLKLLTGNDTPLEIALHRLLECLESRYLQLRGSQYTALKADYLGCLYRRGERHRFASAASEFDGIITGIDSQGKLEVETPGGLRYFGMKEIAFIDAR